MKQIRNSVFETNSSSTHSVTISMSGGDYLEKPSELPVIKFGEFGWEEVKYSEVEDKLSYFVTMIGSKISYMKENEERMNLFLSSNHFLWLKEMVKEHCGFDLVVEMLDEDLFPFGYVDHQSQDTLSSFWSDDKDEFKKLSKDFIFNIKYGFMTDNDNH